VRKKVDQYVNPHMTPIVVEAFPGSSLLPLSLLSSPFWPSFILESAYPTSNGTSVKIDTLNVHERNTCIFTELGLFFALKYFNVRKTQTSTSDDATSANVALILFL
jgi:hypothetical protein